MPSVFSERAIEDTLRIGNALVKFISANDASVTGHQSGFYLPKSAWRLYAPFGPVKGRNDKSSVVIVWPDGLETGSSITWYGRGTRSEYRLTKFGKGFRWLTKDSVGNLLVLTPTSISTFIAYVLETEEDIEEFLTSVGIEIADGWAVFADGAVQSETASDCQQRHFTNFAERLTDFPDGATFSRKARDIVSACEAASFGDVDRLLERLMTTEYALFRVVERQLVHAEIIRQFRSVDEFIETAARIMNRRKARAGRSLENHVQFLLEHAGIRHSMRANVDGRPDVIIPGAREYGDLSFPRDRLIVLGIKTTCKDRWRQIIQEARSVPDKHILTMQPGISVNQLREMNEARVTLIVPREIQQTFPQDAPIRILTIQQFIEHAQRMCT